MSKNNFVKKTIKLQEYESMEVPKHEIAFLHDGELEETQSLIKLLVDMASSLDGKKITFKASSKVGALVVNGLRVEVQPKISATEFCSLIRYVLSGKIPPKHYRSFSELSWGTGFEDALSTLFCDEIDEIKRIGLSRRYEEHCEALPMVRGRPLWTSNFPWRGAKSKEIVCRYYHLTYDNMDNRLLLAGLKSANLLANESTVKSRLHRHIKLLMDISSDTNPEPSQFEAVSKNYNRLNEHYNIAHNIAKLFLFKHRPDDFFDQGINTVTGVVLDMAYLFEKFIERFITESLKNSGLTIKSQTRDYGALLNLEGKRYASVRPDIEVWKGGEPVGVIDAKYKPYWMAADDTLKPYKKVSNEDLYQLFFYQQRMQNKYKLPQSPFAIIASPLPDTDERNNLPIISNKYKRIFWKAGHEKGGEVNLLLIPMTKYLRLLKEKSEPPSLENIFGSDIVESWGCC